MSKRDPIEEFELQRRESLRISRLGDQEENAQSKPADGEHPRLSCIWTVEAFLPSHMPRLERHLEQLGWLAEGRIAGRDWLSWIQQVRVNPWGGGWMNLGSIQRTGDTRQSLRSLFGDYRAPLPHFVDHANVKVVLPIPSTLLVICQFVLSATRGRELEDMLRADFTSQHPPAGGGWEILDPVDSKRRAISRWRERQRHECAQFVRDSLGGFFADQGTLAPIPSAELVTFELGGLHPRQTEVQSWHLLKALGLNVDVDQFASAEEQGLIVVEGDRRDSEDSHLVFAFARGDAQSPSPQSSLHQATPAEAIPGRLDGPAELLAIWGLLKVVGELDAQMVEVRDGIGHPPLASSELSADTLAEIEVGLASLGGDLLPILSDFRAPERIEKVFRHGNVFAPIQTRFHEGNLGQLLAWRCEQYLGHLRAAYDDSTRIVSLQGQLAARRASERVAATNLQLQVATMVATLLSLVVAVAALIVAL